MGTRRRLTGVPKLLAAGRRRRTIVRCGPGERSGLLPTAVLAHHP
ncbi:hypothetical protein [Micromonospora chersina]